MAVNIALEPIKLDHFDHNIAINNLPQILITYRGRRDHMVV